MMVLLFNALSCVCAVEPVYYGHLGTNDRSFVYQSVLIFQVNMIKHHLGP